MMDGMDFPSPDEDPIFLARHPLYNSVVLASLFKKLCLDLPKCRLVCKQWHRQSRERWRSTRTLHLDYLETFSETPSENDDGSIVNISDSLKLFLQFLDDPSSECIKVPYRKLAMISWQFQLGPNGMFNHPWIERLCWGPILGAHITTLTLSFCKFSGVKEFQLIIYRFCPALQNLILDSSTCDKQKSLGEPTTYREPEYGEQTNLKSITISEMSQGLPVSYLELFSHFPSLHSIEIQDVRRDSTVMEVLDALKVVKMHDANKLPIDNFEVTPHIFLSRDERSLRTCAILQEYNIPVNRVFFIVEDGLNRELVRNFVTIQANSLMAIEFNKIHLDLEWTFQLGGPLKKLETLKIRTWTDPFTDMEFLQNIPNLRSLSFLTDSVMGPHSRHPLTQMISNTLDTEEMASLKLLKLEELKMGFTLGAEDMRKLMKWFPNITKLEMVLDDAQFSIVCRNWPNLDLINVYGKELTDTGVMGRRPAENQEEDDAVRPTITCLKKLTSFGARDCDKITGTSVLHGFLKMNKLRHLQLHTITKRAKIALRGKGIFHEP